MACARQQQSRNLSLPGTCSTLSSDVDSNGELLKLNAYAHHLGILLNYRFGFSLEWGLTCSVSNKLPGGADAAGPHTPL